MAAVFGVHLGSSTASIAICQDGKAEIVANDAGDRTTPAIVACSGKEKSVGIPARQGLIRNAANTICRVKNVVGKEFNDTEVQAYIKSSPCKLVLDKEELKFELDDGNGKKQLISVHEVLVLLYSKTMETANRRCGESDSQDAVIAVPLHFTEVQRDVMRQAASDAGFNVLQVVSEPAAALLGYNIGQKAPKEDKYCLVYRIGGSSLDVAAIHVSNGIYHIMAHTRHTDVGGDQMTDLLVSHFIEEFRRQYHLDVRESRRSVAKLLVAAENCKHVLSTMSTAQCFVESLHEGCDFNSNITRARYESILNTLLPNCMSPIDKVLEAAGLTHSNISKVILSGGATKTPKLQQIIADYFPSADVMSSVLPDEIIALGAANQAAFLVPILNGLLDGDVPSASFKDVQEPLAVILAPTRELAIQIHNEARKFAHGTILKSVVIYGGTSVGYQSRQLQAGCHVLVATPGRLMDFVEKGKVAFGQLRYFVLDEADRMLDMGFMPSVREVVNHNTTPPKSERHTLMFSATFPEEIQKLAAEFLEDYLFLAVGLVGAANRDVLQSFYQIEKFSKRDKLIEVLSEAIEKKEKVLVFVDTKRTADFVASLMSQKGFPTTSIHGDRLQREREEALSDFRSGTMPVLVATAVAARGLDIKDVSYVVNYDLPKSIEEYVHRIGRTGRVGNLGKATSFYDSGEDQPLAKALIKILQDAHQEVPDWLVAEGSGMGGYTQSYSRGKFGARDIRGMKDSGGDDWENSSAGGFGTGISSAAGNIGCDESWD